MTTRVISPKLAAARAGQEVLETQWRGEPGVRLDSPPGAGKTWIVEALAVQSLGLLHERCMISTQTNEQSFDIARRLAARFPRHTFYLFTRRGLAVPDSVRSQQNVRIVHSPNDFPTGPCVVIGNAAKWSWINDPPGFDLQVVDEAFQLPDFRFHQIANLARRFVLVGDPGQIAPVIACEVERWKCDPAGPHIACPRALSERHPAVPRLSLPVSRRLVPDTVRFVQPAFYPDLPFTAFSAAGQRRIKMSVPASGRLPIDPALDCASCNASIALVQLPTKITGEVDDELAETIVQMVERLFERRTLVLDDGETRALEPSMVGIVCAHVSQVNAIRERLPRNLSDVFVETSDRFQGLERPLMIIHHPLSGRADASAFHLDAGRLCVMMSRHRISSWLVSRAGLERQLLTYAPSGERILGVREDREYQGWRAHLSIVQQLERERRIFPLVLN